MFHCCSVPPVVTSTLLPSGGSSASSVELYLPGSPHTGHEPPQGWWPPARFRTAVRLPTPWPASASPVGSQTVNITGAINQSINRWMDRLMSIIRTNNQSINQSNWRSGISVGGVAKVNQTVIDSPLKSWQPVGSFRPRNIPPASPATAGWSRPSPPWLHFFPSANVLLS